MPKVGMEPIRRQQLIEATIQVIGEHGFADTTVSRISRRAGVSAGIIHHYFGGKNELLEAALRSQLHDLKAEMVKRTDGLTDPRERLYATIDANFTEHQFSQSAVNAWIAFWAQANAAPTLARLQRVYDRRLRSNLLVSLLKLQARPAAEQTAFGMALMIDGLSLHSAVGGRRVDTAVARRMVRDYLDRRLAGETV